MSSGNEQSKWQASTECDAIAINRLLMQRQCEVFHLAVAQASLEDIFLSLTTNEMKEME